MRPIYFLLFFMYMVMTANGCATKRTIDQVDTAFSLSQTAKPVPFQELTGYFVKNTYRPISDVNPIVIQNPAPFNELFGMAKTMDNAILPPDFNVSIVVALILRSTGKETTITLSDTKIEKGMLNVYYTVNTGEEQSYTFTPVALSTIEKSIGINTIRFFVNGQERGRVMF